MALIIEFQNVSPRNVLEDDPHSVYRYRVRVNTHVIEQGTVAGHRRSNGWEWLVRLFLDARTPSVPDATGHS
jgi:hypothetical protein